MKYQNPNRQLKIRIGFYALASVLTAGFIFYNSIQSPAESGEISGRLAALLQNYLDPNGVIGPETFHGLIRKAAHFLEFALLGLFVGGFSGNLGKLRLRRYVALPMLLTLSTAVADELLQLFTQRGSSVADVALDYAGALFGLGFMALLSLLFRRRH